MKEWKRVGGWNKIFSFLTRSAALVYEFDSAPGFPKRDVVYEATVEARLRIEEDSRGKFPVVDSLHITVDKGYPEERTIHPAEVDNIIAACAKFYGISEEGMYEKILNDYADKEYEEERSRRSSRVSAGERKHQTKYKVDEDDSELTGLGLYPGDIIELELRWYYEPNPDPREKEGWNLSDEAVIVSAPGVAPYAVGHGIDINNLQGIVDTGPEMETEPREAAATAGRIQRTISVASEDGIYEFSVEAFPVRPDPSVGISNWSFEDINIVSGIFSPAAGGPGIDIPLEDIPKLLDEFEDKIIEGLQKSY